MTADIVADWSNRVIVADTPLADLFRFAIAAMSGATAALLLRLYVSHRTGRMNGYAGAGAVATYVVVAWAQIVAITSPTNDLTSLNFGVAAAVGLSLAGTLKAMDVRLFR